MDDPGLEARTRLGPPGVDIERFAPREPEAARRGPGGAAPRGCARTRRAAATADSSVRPRPRRAAARARSPRIDPARDRLVVFVGKLIASKGVDLLLAAWPLVLAARAGRAAASSSASARSGRAWRRSPGDLARGDLAAARARGRGRARPAGALRAFLDGSRRARRAPTSTPPPTCAGACTGRGGSSTPSSPTCCPPPRRWSCPSTFPEAFGMVAAEAAACGALPVVARHSGLAEVARALAGAVPAAGAAAGSAFERRRRRRARELADRAGRLARGARARCGPPRARRSWRSTRERYSWDGVARTVIAAAQGRLDELPRRRRQALPRRHRNR